MPHSPFLVFLDAESAIPTTPLLPAGDGLTLTIMRTN